MDRETFPKLELERDEIILLQEIINEERSDAFNYYFDLKINNQDIEANREYQRYQLISQLRDKIYHLTGRDTLAPTGYHEQRWDQPHDNFK